ncbi:MAG: amino acid adenylation domain-containing protein [Desulfobacterales bacterium]|nr:amino acid adenylation domain-containing protein [Desulfobacterales bacterium]
MNDILERFEALSAEKRKQVLQKLREKKTRAGGDEEIAITRAPRGGALPISFGQRRLWFLDQIEGESAHYNEFAARTIRGPLEIDVLARCLTEILRRHEALRATFSLENGGPVQRIAPPAPASLEVNDWRLKAGDWKWAEIRRVAAREAQRPFDLSRGPLFRASVTRMEEERHVLMLNVHHIVFDRWSGDILLHELASLYDAFRRGRRSPLPELEIQYVDFAAWQRRRLDGGGLEKHLAYWRQRLSDAPRLLELPADRPRPPTQTFRGGREWFDLDDDLTRSLRTVGRGAGATLFATLLTAFAILLHRSGGPDDMVIGVPVSMRNHKKLEPLIGFFVNMLALRVDLPGNPAFSSLLDQVRQTTLEAFAHQETPFEKIVEALESNRDRSHSALFQVMFVLENERARGPMPSDLSFTPLESGEVDAKFDLTLAMEEAGESLRGCFEYNIDLFDKETVRAMIPRFQTLLEGIAADPDRPAGRLPLLTASRQRRILTLGQGPRAEYTRDKCVHQLFEARVRRSPEATAMVFKSQRLSFRDLNTRANRLAHCLLAAGVGPEVFVGVHMARSMEMITALLGILKAGGAYVPMDPRLPPERKTFILEDAGIRTLVTDERPTPAWARACDLVIHPDRDGLSGFLGQNPVTEVAPGGLAYAIYTSGSTGTPKGVMIEHRSLVNFALSAIDVYGLTKEDRVLQFASISFDAAVEEIYPCLLRGGIVAPRTDEMLDSPERFLAGCRDLGITVLDLPTAYWSYLTREMVVRGLWPPESIRMVIIGGEKAPPERVQAWRDHVGERPELINTYGPTEATVVATGGALSSPGASSAPSTKSSIGRPFPNVRAHVLDPYLQPTPMGVPGELHLAGPGLARGYLNRPDLTREKFIPNPFDPGALLYKTGDRVRLRPDGDLEYLGRLDHQVKIRGFRVEPGEIEAALARIPGVKEAAVAAREDPPGPVQLAAYIVPDPGGRPTAPQLRAALGKKLPGYMIPAAFVFMDAIPLTTAGKVDRRALPAPDLSENLLEEGYAAPRTATEKILAEIWAEALGVERVGVRNNFFSMGGHSLLAAKVLSRVRDRFRVAPSLAALFDGPTVAEFSRVIDAAPKTREEPGPGIRRLPRRAVEK